jgi:hypothetical protein
MIKGRHLALYQIFKTTVYTTKYRVGLKTGRRKTGRANFDNHPSGLKALWMILVSRDDTTYDKDFAMYYSLYNIYTSKNMSY